MKKNILLVVFAFAFTLLSAQTYHFQEGFESAIPSGWIRNCAGTSSLQHGLYPGINAVKFDIDNQGQAKQLESPAFNGAGTLSFWASRNANAVYFDLHVCKIVNGVSTELKKIINTDISKKPEWTEIIVPINDPSNDIKIMIWAEDAGSSTSFVAIDDIALTTYDGDGEEPKPDSGKRTAYDRISTKFDDGTWGEIASALPSSGSYPTDTINDFILNKAIVYTGSTTDKAGEKHVNRIGLDKKSTGGCLELPWLKTVGQIEVHAAVGTVGNSFTIDEYINDDWNTLQTFSAIKTDSTFYLNIERNDTTRLRISNNSGGATVIWKVASRSLSDVKDLNVFSTIPVQNAVCFYNLTKDLTVTFNKEVIAGTGNLILNGIEIPVSACSIESATVNIPVSLESTQGTNKAYTLFIPAGTFIDKNTPTNYNNEYTLNFETLRKPNMPANYAEIIDIQYSSASAEMCRMDFYYPSDATKPTPVVINMHGGGWNHGAKEEQTGFGTFTGMGFAVANVEYRMTPQAKAPAAVEDIRCAMQYLINNATTLNIDPQRIIFQGASAGGHLALTAAYLQNNRIYDTNCNDYQGDIKVFAVIDKYGPAELNDFMFYTSLVNWLGDNATNEAFVQSISPAHLVDANTPPTYIVHGDADPTVPYSQSVTLANKLNEFNVYHQFTTIPDGKHGGFGDKYNTQISNEIITFLTYLMDNATAIEQQKSNTAFRPSVDKDHINFNMQGNAIYEIFNMAGKKIAETNANSISLTQSGVFIVKANTNEKIMMAKIVK